MTYKMNPGVVFESNSIEKILEDVMLNKSNEKVGDILVELARNTAKEPFLLQIINQLLRTDLLL